MLVPVLVPTVNARNIYQGDSHWTPRRMAQAFQPGQALIQQPNLLVLFGWLVAISIDQFVLPINSHLLLGMPTGPVGRKWQSFDPMFPFDMGDRNIKIYAVFPLFSESCPFFNKILSSSLTSNPYIRDEGEESPLTPLF